MPEAWDRDVRKLVERPYRLIYRATPSLIEVVAILPGRQDLDAASLGNVPDTAK